MLATSQKLLHHARSLRFLPGGPDDSSRNHTIASISGPLDLLPLPPLSPARPMAIDMPLPPSRCPATAVSGASSTSSLSPSPSPRTASAYSAYSHIPMPPAPQTPDLPLRYRHVSSCSSHISRASSSWSSTSSSSAVSSASSASSGFSRATASIPWDPLRLHPSLAESAPPLYFDDGYATACDAQELSASTPTTAFAAFAFGLDDEPCSSSSRLPSSDSDSDCPYTHGLAPPPRHHKLRSPKSTSVLRSAGATPPISQRPFSPPPPMPTTYSAPSSPPLSPRRRQPPAADADPVVERYLRRDDWKRRGIIFGTA